jgi:HEAT repeat protein
LLEEVLRPFDEQTSRYEGVSVHPPVTLSETLAQMDSPLQRERKEAVARLPWFSDPGATDRLLKALRDRSFKVRKAAVKALAGIDDPRCEEALHTALAESSPKLASWIRAGLKLIADMNILREAKL